MSKLLVVIFFLFLFTANALATPLSLSVSPTRGTTNDEFILKILSTEGDTIDDFVYDPDPNFYLAASGQSVGMNNINGRVTSYAEYSFTLKTKRELSPGDYAVPQIVALKGKERIQLNRPSIKILHEQARGVSKEIEIVQSLSNDKPYIGEQVLYQTQIATKNNLVRANLDEAPLPRFWKESLGENTETRRNIPSQGKTLYTVSEAIFPTEAGDFSVPQRKLVVQLSTGQRSNRMGFGIFQSHNTVRKNFFAKAIPISVKPLPAPPAGTPSTIPVGELKFNNSLDKTTAEEGSSINLKIAIAGDANLRPLALGEPFGEDVKHFKIYADEPVVTTWSRGTRVYFKKEFSIALVPLKAGTLEIPQYRFHYFNPKLKKYENFSTTKQDVNISASSSANSILISRPDDTSSDQKNSKEIKVIAEGMAPQSVSQAAFKTQKKINDKLAWAIIGLTPLFFVLLIAVQRKMQNIRSNPLIQKRAKAYSTIQKQLNATNERDFSELSLALNTYISDKFSLPKPKVSSGNIEKELKSTLPEGLLKSTTGLLSKLEKLQFSSLGRGTNSKDSDRETEFSAIKQEINVLVGDLEKCIKS